MILIAGPGFKTYQKEEVRHLTNVLKKQGNEVINIGNGEDGVSTKEMYKTLSNVRKDLFHTQSPSTTVIVHAHGTLDERNIDLRVHLQKEGKSVLSKEIFINLSYYLSFPLGVVMATCHAGASLNNSRHLPQGSKITALAPYSKPLNAHDVFRFSDSLFDEHEKTGSTYSTSQIIDIYLTKSLQNRTAPIIQKIGGQRQNLEEILKNRLGTRFSNDESSQIHNRLDDLIPPQKIDILLSIISRTKDISKILDIDYGGALAICLAADDLAIAKQKDANKTLLSEAFLLDKQHASRVSSNPNMRL